MTNQEIINPENEPFLAYLLDELSKNAEVKFSYTDMESKFSLSRTVIQQGAKLLEISELYYLEHKCKCHFIIGNRY